MTPENLRSLFVCGATADEFKASLPDGGGRIAQLEALVQADRDASEFARPGLKLNVLVIAEGWCRDSQDGSAVLLHLAGGRPGVSIRFFGRDEHPDLMAAYRKDGQFDSIPVMVFLDPDFNELGRYVERPDEVTALYERHRADLAQARPEFGPADAAVGSFAEPVKEQLKAAMKELRERDRPVATAIIAAALNELAGRGPARTGARTHASGPARSGGRILFRNIGTLLSGDLAEPILSASSVLVEDGVISEIGTEPDADVVIDVHGATLAPGLWDSHFHPYFGDYSPRQKINGAVERTAASGVTTLVSAGAGHQPGMYLPSPTLPNVQAGRAGQGHNPVRARDARGSKALAITMAAAWQSARPSSIKCYAGTVFAEDGFVRDDFTDMMANGVRLLKFQRPMSSISQAQTYRGWAAELDLLVMTHTGNRPVTTDTDSIIESLQAIDPDIAGHVNGGPTPAPRDAVDWLIDHGRAALELVFIGNLRVAARVLERAAERGELHRIILGTDLPGGTGVVPGAVLRTIQLLSHLTDIPVAQLYCMATGNTARVHRLPGGRVAIGAPADLVAWDPVVASETDEFLDCVAYGDRAYPGLVMIDGVVTQQGNPLLLAPKRMPTIHRNVSPATAGGSLQTLTTGS
jgi:enamidase